MLPRKKGKFNCMGKIKGIIGFAALALIGCGGSSTEALPDELGNEPLPESSFEVLPESSADDFLTSSFVDVSVSSSADEIPLSYSDEPSVSSSSDGPISSSADEPISSSLDEPTSSSLDEPLPGSSSSLRSHPEYSKILGADVSQMQEYEAKGIRVLDVDGTPKDIFDLLWDHGFNYIRLKTFVGPSARYGYAAPGCNQGTGEFPQNVEAFGDKDHVVAYAKRAKAAGFKLLLDFHYSDNWADPGKQIIPERWRGVRTSDAMADSVYAYTKDVLLALQAAGALPEMVQVGNEITNGMLREIPKSNTDCWGNNVQAADGAVSGVMSNATGIANTAKYLAAGSRAVKEISNNIKVVFHIESPHKTNTVDWWMSSIIKNSKVSPDVMAFSAYSAYEHGNPDSWKNLMTNLGKTYTNLEFLIAEYNGSSTPDNYGFDGSRVKTHQVMEQVPRALGAFIWEPERSGAWGTALFDWVGGDLKANKRAFDEYEVLF
ncbi:hypothetical protein B7992_03555 [Fibrobacter sp. UWH1]|nr:hypothetical protein B7992_03555 [Fibrobacter sp. UWH1]